MSTTLLAHLKERHLEVSEYSTIYLCEELGKVYFYLYGFSGEFVGYQCYTPSSPKRAGYLEDAERRYHTFLGKEGESVKKTAFGLETITETTTEIFVTEGVFDACRLHKLGLSAIALLGSDIGHLKEQLFLLGIKLIPVCEGDTAGLKLAALATHEEVIYLEEGYDLGEMEESEIIKLVKKYIKV